MPPYESINLHPSTHLTSSIKSHTYDVICIGSGWAGRIIAARIVKAGLTAIIVEDELVGGDCPFWACVPSKALLRPNEALETAKSVGGARERIYDSQKGVEVEAVFKRRDAFTANFDDSAVLVPLVENSGAHLVRGTGKIVGERKVKIEPLKGEAIELEAKYAVVICTGSEPIIPDVPGLREAKPWTPREATSSSEVPEHLLVIGGGAVGSEMATAYSSFGAKVTLVNSTEEILSKVDPEAGKLVRESLSSHGVQIIVSAKITEVSREANKSVNVKLSNGDIITASEILVAVGRRAKTTGIGLEELGLKADGTPIPVDESLCVDSVLGGWLYAAGDVNGRAPLTHSSKYHGRIVSNTIISKLNKLPESRVAWGRISATADRRAMPQVIFTDPTVASVGLTRTRAQAAGITFREVTAPAKTLGAILHADGYQEGWAQWIIEEISNKLLGATFVGRDVADLLHASTMAIVGGMTIEQMAHAVPSFPTMSEVYLNLLDAAGL
ncbi:mercuric reductase [Glonium stellatum]|uniref:Mercuric reductase n=1 Tax=Glonium stellatum TaxID=574774 RepID=A0A8E2F160_9PEZI|nr:mercuric reductase [Glonium stellatum]